MSETVTREEAKTAFRATKVMLEGTQAWIGAANVVDAYIEQGPEPHPDAEVWVEVRDLLAQLDSQGGEWHHLIGDGSGTWQIVNGTHEAGFNYLEGTDAPFRFLRGTRDKLREMVSPQPSPEDEIEKERKARKAAEGLAKTRGQQREQLGLRIDELESTLATRDATINGLRSLLPLRVDICPACGTTAIIEGLTILEKYHDATDGYNIGAEHDVIYAYSTDRPVSLDDLKRLVELGWFQEEVEYDDEFLVEHYDQDESWACYT